MHTLISYVFGTTHLKHSIECGIHHTPESRQNGVQSFTSMPIYPHLGLQWCWIIARKNQNEMDKFHTELLTYTSSHLHLHHLCLLKCYYLQHKIMCRLALCATQLLTHILVESPPTACKMLDSQLRNRSPQQVADLQFTASQVAGSHYKITHFSQALNIVFSKTKMFKLQFILFVIKELLGKVT